MLHMIQNYSHKYFSKMLSDRLNKTYYTPGHITDDRSSRPTFTDDIIHST